MGAVFGRSNCPSRRITEELLNPVPVEGPSSDDDEPLAGPPLERPAVPDAPRRPRPRTAAEHAGIRYYVVWNVAGAREEIRGVHEGSIAAWRYLER